MENGGFLGVYVVNRGFRGKMGVLMDLGSKIEVFVEKSGFF